MHHYYFISCEEDERAWIEISSMFNWEKLQELMLCLIGGENGKGEKEKREEDEIFHYLVGVKREMVEFSTKPTIFSLQIRKKMRREVVLIIYIYIYMSCMLISFA